MIHGDWDYSETVRKREATPLENKNSTSETLRGHLSSSWALIKMSKSLVFDYEFAAETIGYHLCYHDFRSPVSSNMTAVGPGIWYQGTVLAFSKEIEVCGVLHM